MWQDLNSCRTPTSPKFFLHSYTIAFRSDRQEIDAATQGAATSSMRHLAQVLRDEMFAKTIGFLYRTPVCKSRQSDMNLSSDVY